MNIESSRIIESLRSHKLVDGLTHNFYSYPARFSPELTKEIIGNFSSSGDWVFDPFMGGGTSVVESLAMGRNALGVDINSLAWFVTLNKTTPLSSNEVTQLREWASSIDFNRAENFPSLEIDELRRHFPKRFLCFLDNLLESTKKLESQSSKRLARFAILIVYQSALNNRSGYPSSTLIKKNISSVLEKIFLGLERFLIACKESGFTKQKVVSSRKILKRSSISLETDNRIKDLIGHQRLVFTSPPYPGVHVLYNKWQIASRKETYLPYYISGLNDSQPEAYYTFGGRSISGMSKYFDLISQSFLSISKIIHPKAIVIQLIGFSDSHVQLPLYLKAMEVVGYREIFPLSTEGERLWREVPNRKWYTSGREKWDASKEVLLFHTLAKSEKKG